MLIAFETADLVRRVMRLNSKKSRANALPNTHVLKPATRRIGAVFWLALFATAERWWLSPTSKRARGKGDRHGENDSEMVAACLCDGTLALLAFYGTDEQKSGIDGVVSSQATFPITSDARRRKINDTSKNCPDLQGAHERLQAVASGTAHPRAPAVATDVLDLAFVNGDGRERAELRDMRPVIAILVDETVDGDLERGRDRRPKVALRTWRWDSNCGGALSPGDW